MIPMQTAEAKTTIIIAHVSRAYHEDMTAIIRQLNPDADVIIMPTPQDDPGLPTDARLDRLSNRQRAVLSLLVEGRSNKDIARSLAISPSTVRVHVSAVLRVLGLSSRTAAAAFAARTMAAPYTPMHIAAE